MRHKNLKTKKQICQEEEKQDTKNLKLRNGIWHVNAMINGIFIRKSLKTTDLSEARIKRDLILLPIRATKDERQLLTSVKRQLEGLSAEEERRKQEENKGVKLLDAWDTFVKDPQRRKCTEQTFNNHRSNWNRFMRWMQKKHPEIIYCREVTRAVCTEWAGDMLTGVKATNTYNHYISSVRYVFTSITAIDEDFKHPMRFIHKKKDVDCVSKQPFTDEELKKIFSSMNKEFRLLCAIGLYTTLRLGSARKLKWEMFDANLEYLDAVHDKTGADASQHVAAELKEILEEVPASERHGYICPTYASLRKDNAAHEVMIHFEDLGIQTHKEMQGLNGKVRRACIKGFHSFRHTGITRALQNGATVSQVKRLAGHASEKMQERYTHLGADDAGKANALIGRFW